MDPDTPAKTTIYHSHEICIMTSSHNDGRRKCPQIQARLELILLFTNCLQYYVDVIRLGIYMFVHRIRKTSQRHFSTIHFGGLGLRAMVRGWVIVRVGVRVRVGVIMVRKVLGSR